jgi:uncharacterized protein GlcG (DUF336 family)
MGNNTITKKGISAEATKKIILNACNKAKEINLNIAITIIDEGGNLKGFHRMDGAVLIANSASYKKAFTALGFGMPTGDTWYGFIKDDPILMNGSSSLKDFTLLGGGSPIIIDKQIVGAIGVSGGHYKQDEECVNAALKSL